MVTVRLDETAQWWGWLNKSSYLVSFDSQQQHICVHCMFDHPLMQIRFSVGFATHFSCTDEFIDGFPQVGLAPSFFPCKTLLLVKENVDCSHWLPPSLFCIVGVIVAVIDYDPSTTCMFPSLVLSYSTTPITFILQVSFLWSSISQCITLHLYHCCCWEPQAL